MHGTRWTRFLIASLTFPLVLVACSGGKSLGVDTAAGSDGGEESILDTAPIADASGDLPVEVPAGCLDECGPEGATACSLGGVSTCAEVNSDGCLRWSLPVACPSGKTCRDGQCVVACPDAPCSVIGAHRCRPGSDRTIEECNDFDRDGCLEWGTPQASP